MNWIFRFCVALCMVAGVSLFGAACGDDNGGGGDSCPEGQVEASITGVNDGQPQCYEECSAASDCSEAGSSCTDGVCVPPASNNGTGNNGTGNNGTGNNGTGNNGTGCASGEIEADPFGDGAACYTTCTSNDECTGEEECAELSDGSTSICVEFPAGDATCTDILTCTSSCGESDNQCFTECMYAGTRDAQDAFVAINQCFADNNCGDAGASDTCFRDNCQAEIEACAGCAEGETEVNFQCLTPCETDGECASDESCEVPLLFEDDSQKYCNYDINSWDACASDGDCIAPDSDVAPGSEALCRTEIGSMSLPGGACLPIGCQLGINDSAKEGPESGCGLNGYCAPAGDDGTGNQLGLCQAYCRSIDDCRTSNADGWTCQYVAADARGPIGICFNACTADADCSQFGQGSRCNTTEGYCEFTCSSDADCQGGTCGSEGFCEFATAG